MTKVFGKHLILDITGMNDGIRDAVVIQQFIDELVFDILKMKKKGDTIFEYFSDTEYNRQRDIVGYSVCQIISLSSITLHLNDLSGTAYMDIFTCGDILTDDIINCVRKYFNPQTIHDLLISRDAYAGQKIIS
jgi:S-adenosylmethionine/arginine decarboxylase-like enzyme